MGKHLLSNYLPESCVEKVAQWFVEHNARLKISKARSSKLGDYRPPYKGLPHRISVNHNLNPYEFLITLTHEMAHLICWERYGRRVRPHGPEWRLIYKQVFKEISEHTNLPEDIQQAMSNIFNTASSQRISHEGLKSVLRKYDPVNNMVTVADLKEGTTFVFHRRTFRKMQKVRTRYRCFCLNNNRLYAFSPLVQVLPAESR